MDGRTYHLGGQEGFPESLQIARALEAVIYATSCRLLYCLHSQNNDDDRHRHVMNARQIYASMSSLSVHFIELFIGRCIKSRAVAFGS